MYLYKYICILLCVYRCVCMCLLTAFSFWFCRLFNESLVVACFSFRFMHFFQSAKQLFIQPALLSVGPCSQLCAVVQPSAQHCVFIGLNLCNLRFLDIRKKTFNSFSNLEFCTYTHTHIHTPVKVACGMWQQFRKKTFIITITASIINICLC